MKNFKNLETVTMQLMNPKEIESLVAMEKQVLKERVPVRRLQLRRAGSTLSIDGNAFGNWLKMVNAKDGIFFLDLEIPQAGPILEYALNYKDKDSGRLLRLKYAYDPQSYEECEKRFIQTLLFDLILFQADEPIVVFDKEVTEKFLLEVSVRYFEFGDRIDAIIARLVDMKQVFAQGMYVDSRIEELSINGIYHALNPGSSVNMATQGSYALYLIYMALQSIFHQLHGLKIAA
jgi:hypothetical protein